MANLKTAYSVYNKDQKKRTQKSHLDELYPDLPDSKYDILYMDPPWDYGGKMQFDRSSTAAEKVNLDKPIFISSASFKYPTLKMNDLHRLDIPSIAADDCLLFMWATNPHLDKAIDLGKKWGFEYKTVAFVWNKMVHNPGRYTMSYCELCLVFKKGKIPSPRGARNIKQLVESPRGKHSEKPSEVREGIHKMFPTQRKLELFSRVQVDDWDAWGLESFDVKYDDLRTNKANHETTEDESQLSLIEEMPKEGVKVA